MVSLTEENYLKALFSLSGESGNVNVSKLSQLLEVSLPTVNSMMKGLKKKDLVKYEKYKPLTLTDKGKQLATSVIRKHRLTEIYLVEKMGFGWEEVHGIAEQLEHIDSNIFFDRMDELLNFPTIDPHGSPIPDKNGNINRNPYQSLNCCSPGELVKLTAISNDSSDFLKFLNSRDLKLGVIIEIKSIEPFDKSMNVSYQSHSSETFSMLICENLLVESLQN